MRLGHVIEVNSPTEVGLTHTPLTRGQIWRGLVLRAERPTLFIPHLDECLIRDRCPEFMSRTLRYGTMLIHDEVRFVPEQSVEYLIPAQSEMGALRLMVTIEEPQPGALCVRFEYEDDPADAFEGPEEALFQQVRHSAYQEADSEALQFIRKWTEDNQWDILGQK